jgi:hypothetical protein
MYITTYMKGQVYNYKQQQFELSIAYTLVVETWFELAAYPASGKTVLNLILGL